MKVPTLESRTRRALGKRGAYVVRVTAAGPGGFVPTPPGGISLRWKARSGGRLGERGAELSHLQVKGAATPHRTRERGRNGDVGGSLHQRGFGRYYGRASGRQHGFSL